jgi:hypothetical protein
LLRGQKLQSQTLKPSARELTKEKFHARRSNPVSSKMVKVHETHSNSLRRSSQYRKSRLKVDLCELELIIKKKTLNKSPLESRLPFVRLLECHSMQWLKKLLTTKAITNSFLQNQTTFNQELKVISNKLM